MPAPGVGDDTVALRNDAAAQRPHHLFGETGLLRRHHASADWSRPQSLLPIVSLLMLHIVLTLFYLANFLVRLYALGAPSDRRGTDCDAPACRHADRPLPVYSVLVALYKEESVAAQLVDALDRLDWPRSRLDIKLICEEDDEETIAALEALRLAPEYEIVLVPVQLPRTKPKALSYALPGVRGTFVTVYDAEDRPHPGQLREATPPSWPRRQRVICLQAPLIITNARQSWWSALFALEYAGLFRGLLPMLSLTGLPLPLGGTSNHFRTAELKQIGGWDPYNMTEDADLGLRLHRLGYRSQVIFKPTFEDAPASGRLARPADALVQGLAADLAGADAQAARLGREMGWLAFTVFQILIAGMLFSSLCHPTVIGFLIYLTWLMFQDGTHVDSWLAFWLFICDIVNIFGSYAVFIALGRIRRCAGESGPSAGAGSSCRSTGWSCRSPPGRRCSSCAANPFSWNKTPHAPSAPGKISNSAGEKPALKMERRSRRGRSRTLPDCEAKR